MPTNPKASQPVARETLYGVIADEEHDRLRLAVREFCVRELAPHARAWESDTIPGWVLPRFGELGFLGLDKPVEYGGRGPDCYASIVLAEELVHANSGGLTLTVVAHTEVAMPSLVAFGSDGQKRRWLRPAIRGQEILCFGATEPLAGSDLASITTSAERIGDEFVINGCKTFVTNGLRAGLMVLLAKTDPHAGHDGFTLFLVPLRQPGVSRVRQDGKLGMRAADTALITFRDVRVPPEAVLGQEGRGFNQMMRGLQSDRLINGACSVAGAQKAFDETLVYAKQRTAFGQPLAEFQVTRHKFAEMATKIEAARQMVYAAAWQRHRGQRASREVAMAKLFASRVASEVADECIQIHGGVGYMDDWRIARLWRDLRLARIGGGTDEIMLDAIGRTYC